LAGPRGPAGHQGDRGEPGPRGEKGERGARDDSASPSTLEQLNEIEHSIEDIYKELDIQMKRMSQIQQQVDELRTKVRQLTGTAT